MDTTLGWGSDVLIWNAVVLTAVSLGVGLLGGFVGLALGTMRLPAMLLMGMAAPTAGGTNILVSSISSIFGAVRHLREGRVNCRLVLIMGGPAFVARSQFPIGEMVAANFRVAFDEIKEVT